MSNYEAPVIIGLLGISSLLLIYSEFLYKESWFYEHLKKLLIGLSLFFVLGTAQVSKLIAVENSAPDGITGVLDITIMALMVVIYFIIGLTVFMFVLETLVKILEYVGIKLPFMKYKKN